MIDINSEQFKLFVKENNLSENEIALLIIEMEKEKALKEGSALFQRNLEAFSKYMPALYKKFKDFNKEGKFSLVYHKDSFNLLMPDNSYFYGDTNTRESIEKDVLKYIEEASFRQKRFADQKDMFGQIHYRYINDTNAILNREALSNIVEVKDVKSLPFLVVIGNGLGYHLEFLYQNLEIPNAYVIEPDEYMFYLSMFVTNYADLFDFLVEHKYTIKLKVGCDKDEIIEDFASFCNSRGRFFLGFYGTYIDYKTPEIDEIISYLDVEYDNLDTGLGFFDDMVFGFCHETKLVEDKKGLLKAKHNIDSDILHKPVFIVCNGPSLDNDLDYLRENQDNAIIVACGSTIDTLYQEGIKPDFFVVTERVPNICKTFEAYNKEFYEDIILIAPSVIHESTYKYFKDTIIFSKAEAFPYLFGNLEDDTCLLNTWGAVTSINPFVSNCGLSSFLELGFKELYLFGVDNGTKVKDKLHAKSSAYGKVLDDGLKQDMSYVLPGNFGGDVITSKYYMVSVSNLNESIRYHRKKRQEVDKNDDFTVYNCADGAALFRCETKHAYDIRPLTKLDKESLKQSIKEATIFHLDLSLDDIMSHLNFDFYDNLVNIVYNVINTQYYTRAEFIAGLNYLFEIFATIAKSKQRIYCDFLVGSMNNFAQQILSALYYKKDENEAINFAYEIVNVVNYFLLDSQKIFRFIPNYIMGVHQDILNYKIGFDHDNLIAPPTPKHVGFVYKEDELKKIKPFVKRYK